MIIVCVIILLLQETLVSSQNVTNTRLVGGGSRHKGRVEVLVNGTWGTVCDDLWNDVAASVVCRSLGCAEGGIATVRASFGQGTGKIWLDDVYCTGHEVSINECVKHDNSGPGACTHAEDAGVICIFEQITTTTTPRPPISEAICISGLVRIHSRSGHSSSMGLVQVWYAVNYSWGYVCDDLWDKRDAEVVCRMLCHTNLEKDALPNCPDSAMPDQSEILLSIMLDDVECRGNETTIQSCRHREWTQHNCDISEAARITCSPEPEIQPEEIPKPDLRCKPDYIDAIFHRTNGNALEAKHLTTPNVINSATCNIINTTDPKTIAVRIPLTPDCGTTLTGNATHITYSNVIKYGQTYTTGKKIRVGSFHITVRCCYPRNYTNYKEFQLVPKNITAQGVGRFNVRMYIYQNRTFTIPVPSYPVTFTIGDYVYVALELNTNDDQLMLLLPFCVTTSSVNRNDVTRCPIIQNSCAVEKTLSIFPLSNTKVGFRFQSFMFIGRPLVYIHCEVFVCIKTEGPCDRSCNSTKGGSFGRKKRALDEYYEITMYGTAGEKLKRNRRQSTGNIYYVDSGPMSIEPLSDDDTFIDQVDTSNSYMNDEEPPERDAVESTLEVQQIDANGDLSNPLTTKILEAEDTKTEILRSRRQYSNVDSRTEDAETITEAQHPISTEVPNTAITLTKSVDNNVELDDEKTIIKTAVTTNILASPTEVGRVRATAHFDEEGGLHGNKWDVKTDMTDIPDTSFTTTVNIQVATEVAESDKYAVTTAVPDSDKEEVTTKVPESNKEDITSNAPDFDKNVATTKVLESNKEDVTTRVPDSDTHRVPYSDKEEVTTKVPDSDKKKVTTTVPDSDKETIPKASASGKDDSATKVLDYNNEVQKIVMSGLAADVSSASGRVYNPVVSSIIVLIWFFVLL